MKRFLMPLFLTMCLLVQAQDKMRISDNYSPLNSKRPVRPSTLYIVLHTTESNDKSGCNAVCRQGTCNYIVKTDGSIQRIIDRKKVAYHAGRSMWHSHTNLSECSIGIEVVGYHNKQPTVAQQKALKLLIVDLQRIYNLSDEAVVTHCMVAYGSANRWFSFNHRGRKRCGMWFTDPTIRKRIGLDNVFTSDPDVAAKRLKNADDYLAYFVYGRHKKASVKITPPKENASVQGVTEPDSKSENPEAFEGMREVDGKGVYCIAGADYAKSTTIYFLPDGRIRKGNELTKAELGSLPKGTKVLVGYVYGGQVSKSRTAYSITKSAWKLPSTFYRLPDQSIISGDAVNDSILPVGSIVLFRR